MTADDQIKALTVSNSKLELELRRTAEYTHRAELLDTVRTMREMRTAMIVRDDRSQQSSLASALKNTRQRGEDEAKS